jgi:hypothetical protein
LPDESLGCDFQTSTNAIVSVVEDKSLGAKGLCVIGRSGTYDSKQHEREQRNGCESAPRTIGPLDLLLKTPQSQFQKFGHRIRHDILLDSQGYAWIAEIREISKAFRAGSIVEILIFRDYGEDGKDTFLQFVVSVIVAESSTSL